MRLLFFILLLLSVHTYGQRIKQIPSPKPKLIVTITVEQMKSEYIERFWDDFGDKGFKRLVNYGTVCHDATVGYSSTQTASGYATIATGTFPQNHGIVGDTWYNRMSSEKEDAIVDEKSKVVGGRPKGNQFSPRKLLASTFSDQLKLHTSMRSKVVSVCMNPQGSLFMTGHMSNGAYWFDVNTGNWVTSTYYNHNLPDWVKTFNDKKIPDLYVAKPWTTSKLITDYDYCSADKNRFEVGYRNQNIFPYIPNKIATKKTVYSALPLLPAGNTLTKDFAIHAIVGEELGKDEITDYLSLSFSPTEEIGLAFGTESIELRDAYIKLDYEIGFFLDFIESECGIHNVLFCLTSTHGVSYNSDYLKSLNFSAGEFKHRKAEVLLESYLNALYGQGDWVSHYENLQFYLNHILIEDTRLDLFDVQEKAAQFLIQITGVAQVFTSEQLKSVKSDDVLSLRMSRSYNAKRSGDLAILLKPGWTEQIVDQSCVHNSPYSPDNDIPLIWYGWKIEKKKVYSSVNLSDIAPTLSVLSGVASPNMATGRIIQELIK